MSEPSRRTFLRHSAAALTALTGAARPAAATPTGRASLDPAVLRAVASVVVPGELGPEGSQRVAADFQRWLEGFEPVAELAHGYGTDQIRYGAHDPAPQWQAQLEALELEARKRHGRGFAELPEGVRREMVRREVGRDRGADMDPLASQHVASALMAFYFSSSEALDLCYEAEIGRFRCRGLANVTERPAPLRGRA